MLKFFSGILNVFCNGNSVIDATEQLWPLVPSTFADDVLHNQYNTVFREGNLFYLTNKYFPVFYRTQNCSSSAENLDNGSSFSGR